MPNPGPGRMPNVCTPATPNNPPQATPQPKPEPYNGDFDKQPPRKIEASPKQETSSAPLKLRGCVFAKSCSLPDGIINHSNPGNFAPLEQLSQYGSYAVLETAKAATASTPLLWVSGSAGASALASQLGGLLSLEAISATASAVAAPLLVGTVALLFPNTTSKDSAFYTYEQLALLSTGNTRARVHMKHLPDGSLNVYGFYTGNNPDWQQVPVIAAVAEGEKLVADLGDGIKLTWTPATDTSGTLGIPALEGAPQVPEPWVFPATEQATKILVNPTLPPDYKDAIIWFPSNPAIPAFYLSVGLRNAPGVVTGIGEDVPGIWLAGAGSGLGVPVPTRIADKLRGREFPSFDAFRKAFWIEIANDPELSAQFNPSNLSDLKKGFSPVAPSAGHVGKRMSFELHHVEHIADGGAVYDVDNIRANTPKNHIDIHKESK
jgi:hypothetical protein